MSDFDNGAARYRPRRRRPRLMAMAEPSAHRPLTPACQGCRYPLVDSDRHCPRCDSAVPWERLDHPQVEAAVEGEGAA